MARDFPSKIALCLGLLLAVALSAVAAPAAQARVGVTSGVDGDPLGRPPAEVEHALRVGIDVQANELITTKADDRAHLMFLDGTSLSVGPNAQLVIDKFVYNPDSQKGELAINASKGVFRLVGGKISKASTIIVNTPSGSMGIRGGIAILIVGPTQTTAIFIFGERMTMTANGQTVTVTRPGFQVVTLNGQAPGAPTLVVAANLRGLLAQLEGGGGNGGRGGNRGGGRGGNADQVALNSGFSNANSGLVLALLTAAASSGGAPEKGQPPSGDAQHVAGQMAAGAPGWQQDLRDYLGKGGSDSGAVVDRARDVFQAYNQTCAEGGSNCNGDTTRAAAQVAANSACAAQVMPVAIADNYVPPRGSVGYDFQPVGVSPARGFRPVVPGDPRLTGGDKYVAEGKKDNLADDSLSDVKRFRAEAPGNGEYRLILIGATNAGGSLTNPFGNQIVINGRAIDVTMGPATKGATIGGKGADGVRLSVSGTVEAPMLVIDLTISSKELDIQFSSGAVVSGLVLEPQKGISALGPNVGNSNSSNSEQCSSAESQIQQAANDGNVPPANPPIPPGPNQPPPPGVISGN